MTTTNTQFIAWLKSNTARRCVLVEVGVQVGGSGADTTRYLSDVGYVTGSADTPANTIYAPVISKGSNVVFTQDISLTGDVSISEGNIELNNINGELDSWLTDVWQNRPIRVYVGDVSWARGDFYKVFDGVVAKMDCTARDKVQLVVSDKLQRLNTTVTDTKLGGATANADKLIPLLFGEAFNISPLLSNPATHEYQVHSGAIEQIIEVRDNGIPVGFTPNLAAGKFTLNQQPAGIITCDAQGDNTGGYVNDVVSIVKRLVKNYGTGGQQLTDSDLDLASLSSFASANAQVVYLYLTDKANVLEECNKLASSIGARLVMSWTGLLSLVKLDLPQSSAGTTVTAADMEERSLHPSGFSDVVAAVQIGFCRNNTIQDSLQTGLPDDQIAMYATPNEWLTSTSTSSTVATQYKLFTNPNMIETQLQVKSDADAEALRRKNIWSVQRKVMTYNGNRWLMLETLGSPQTIQYRRFGLTNGATGQIVHLKTDWMNAKIEIGVLM